MVEAVMLWNEPNNLSHWDFNLDPDFLSHPGEKRPAHESWEDKLAAAEAFREEEDVEMQVLVDDLGGKIHGSHRGQGLFRPDGRARPLFRVRRLRPGDQLASDDPPGPLRPARGRS